MAGLNLRELGEYIREQRDAAEISIRQLAKQAGVSNPYLSQIERGMRRPSADILQQLARALRISAEALYVQAGILDERQSDSDVPGALLADPHITERQKQVLVEIYESFRRENEAAADADQRSTAGADAGAGDAGPVAATAADESGEAGAAEPAATRRGGSPKKAAARQKATSGTPRSRPAKATARAGTEGS